MAFIYEIKLKLSDSNKLIADDGIRYLNANITYFRR